MIRNNVTEYDLIIFHNKLEEISNNGPGRKSRKIIDENKKTFQRVLSHYKESLSHIPGFNDFLSFELSRSKEPKKMHLLSHILGGKFIKSGDKGFSGKNCNKITKDIDFINEIFKDLLSFTETQSYIIVTRTWQKDPTTARWCLA